MRIKFEFSTRLFALIERAVVAIESIDQTLKAAPEDFTEEDSIVNASTAILETATQNVEEAKDRIPHGT